MFLIFFLITFIFNLLLQHCKEQFVNVMDDEYIFVLFFNKANNYLTKLTLENITGITEN